MNSQIFKNEVLFGLRKNIDINFEGSEFFSRAVKLFFIFFKYETYNIGFNYSLVSSNKNPCNLRFENDS